jgi:hypothetical protein
MNIKKIASTLGKVVAAPFVVAGCYVVFVFLFGCLLSFVFWDAEVVRSAMLFWSPPPSFGAGTLRLGGWLFAVFMTYGLLGPKKR